MQHVMTISAPVLFGALGVLALAIIALAIALFLTVRAKARTNIRFTHALHALRMAENVAGVGSWVLLADKSELSWSPQVYAIHDRPEEFGVPPLDEAINYYHPDDRAHVAAHVEKAFETGTGYECRARIVTELGRQKFVISRASCVLDDKGKVTAVFGVFIETQEVVEFSDCVNDNVLASMAHS